MICHMNLLYST